MNQLQERFRCIKSFVVDKYDENDKLVENEGYQINEGALFEKSKYTYLSDVRLENSKGWVEVSTEAFKEHFEGIS